MRLMVVWNMLMWTQLCFTSLERLDCCCQANIKPYTTTNGNYVIFQRMQEACGVIESVSIDSSMEHDHHMDLEGLKTRLTH